MDLIIQVEEATRIKNVITSQLKEKEKRCDDQEVVIMSLKEEAKKMVILLTNQLQEKDEAYQAREGYIFSLKGEIERIAETNKIKSEEVTMLKGHLGDMKTKEKELTNKLQEKDTEITILHERLNKERITGLKFEKST